MHPALWTPRTVATTLPEPEGENEGAKIEQRVNQSQHAGNDWHGDWGKEHVADIRDLKLSR